MIKGKGKLRQQERQQSHRDQVIFLHELVLGEQADVHGKSRKNPHFRRQQAITPPANKMMSKVVAINLSFMEFSFVMLTR